MDTADTDHHTVARMMVGAEVPRPETEAVTPGPALLRLSDVHTPDRGAGDHRLVAARSLMRNR